jgi:hypothetical protein
MPEEAYVVEARQGKGGNAPHVPQLPGAQTDTHFRGLSGSASLMYSALSAAQEFKDVTMHCRRTFSMDVQVSISKAARITVVNRY